jgi:hypothetical protein
MNTTAEVSLEILACPSIHPAFPLVKNKHSTTDDVRLALLACESFSDTRNNANVGSVNYTQGIDSGFDVPKECEPCC